MPVGFEIGEHILGLLGVEDLVAVSRTCKAMYNFVNGSVTLWQELHARLGSPINTLRISSFVTVLSQLSPDHLPLSVAWKRQVYKLLKNRLFYVGFSYRDDYQKVQILFHATSHDINAVYEECEDYQALLGCDLLGTDEPPMHVFHRGAVLDIKQQGFENWRIAIEPVQTEFQRPLVIDEQRVLFIVYTYVDDVKRFDFELRKLFDDKTAAFAFAESLATDLNMPAVRKSVKHTGEIFDDCARDLPRMRVAIDPINFRRKSPLAMFQRQDEEEDTDSDSDDHMIDDEEEEELSGLLQELKDSGYPVSSTSEAALSTFIQAEKRKRSFTDNPEHESPKSKKRRRGS
jgi:hypothetical protein